MADPSVDALARQLARPKAMVRLPRQQPTRIRQAVITKVNRGGHQVHIRLGGSATEIPDVSYMEPYNPQVGHTCWVMVTEPDMFVIGRHAAAGATDI